MPPKRQKPPKLTKEEKLALRQQKREEKKAAQALRKKQLCHAHLERELRYTCLNFSKCEEKWRKMLLRIHLPKCRDELEMAWQNFQQTVDAKDFTVSIMMDELDIAFEQQMVVSRANMSDIDKLIKVFNAEFEDMHTDFQYNIQRLKSEYKEVEDEINLAEANGEEYLRLVTFGILETRKHFEKNVRGEYVQECADFINRNKLILNNMRYDLENEFENLFNHIGNFTNEFLKMTADRRVQYEKLRSSVRSFFGESFRSFNDILNSRIQH